VGLFDRRPKQRLGAPVDAQMDPEQFIAAAVAIRSQEGAEYRRTLPAWQRQALEFYDLIGEAWFPAQFYARMLSRVRLHPAVRKPNGEVDEIFDSKAQEILARVADSGGASGWKYQYGRLQFLIGDGYLTATLDDDDNEQWEYLSPAELVVQEHNAASGKTVYTRKMGDGTPDKTLTEASADLDKLGKNDIRAWRLWRKHPTHSQLADSPLRAVLGLLRVLMLLDKAAEAQAVSRIAGSGLLVVDDRISIPVADVDASDDSVDDDPFMSLLTKYVVTPIGDPGSAGAFSPLVSRVDVPEGMKAEDLITLIQLSDPNQTADWHARIEKTVTRIAIGLDMPPEEFLGLAGANHWTGWVITEEKWKAHGEPVTIGLCEDLTAAYFRQACIDAEVANAENLIVWFDPAQVVTHPDKGDAALKVHEAGELSGKTLREANNFNDSDAPDDEERRFFREMKMKTTERPDDPSEEGEPGTGRNVARDAPDNNGPRSRRREPQGDGADMRIVGAAEMALERLRERAGSLLRSKRMSCDGCFEGTEKLPNAALAAAVGPDIVTTLGFTSTHALVAGGAQPFATTLVRMGVDPVKARVLADRLEDHAAETMFDEIALLPADFVEAA
jgi:hypothetical protein